MEEIKINHPFWKSLILAIGCLEIFALFIRLNGGFNLSEYGFLELLFFFGFGVVGLYFLLVLLKERLLGQPFMRITQNSIVVNRLFRKKVINFCDVKSFEDDSSKFYLTSLNIHYKQKMDNSKDSINLMFINVSVYDLCSLLNKIKKLSKCSSQSTNESRSDKLQKLFEKHRNGIQTAPYSTDSSTQYRSKFLRVFYTFFSLILIIAIAYALIHPDIVNYSVHVSLFLSLFFVTVTVCLVILPLSEKIRSIVDDKLNGSSFWGCLLPLFFSILIFGFIFTSAYLYSEYEDSLLSKFYYHISSNGIRYDIPKAGKKEAIVTGFTQGTFRYTIDIPEFVSHEDVNYPVTEIGKEAFNSSFSLTSVIIGDSVRYIRDDAFCYCSKLEYLKVKSGNPVYYSTDRCDAIMKYKELIVGCANTIIPEDVASIGAYAFSGRVRMTSITIPSSVKYIGKSAFNSCYGLTSVIIPDSVGAIGGFAFYRCKNLTSVVIPEGMERIYYMAFYECNSLTDVYCYAKEPPCSVEQGTPPYHDEYPFDETFIKEHTTLHVPAGSVERYKQEAPWKYFKSIVPTPNLSFLPCPAE